MANLFRLKTWKAGTEEKLFNRLMDAFYKTGILEIK